MLRLKRRECNPIWRNCRRYRLALLLFVMALLFVVGFSVVVGVAVVVGVVAVSYTHLTLPTILLEILLV